MTYYLAGVYNTFEYLNISCLLCTTMDFWYLRGASLIYQLHRLEMNVLLILNLVLL